MAYSMVLDSEGRAGKHIRQYGGVLAGAERRAVVWIATRLPRAVHSDHLSAIALASMAVAGSAFAVLHLSGWAAVAVIAALTLNWLTDSLDGTLARVRHVERPRYGFYVDHVIDIAGACLLLGGLAFSQVMSPIVAVALLAAYLLVSAETYLATHAAGIFRLTFLGVGPTELRILLILGVLKAVSDPWVTMPLVGQTLLFDVGGVVGIAGLGLAFVVSAVRNARGLSREEPRVDQSARSGDA
jgi:phosphatidylglycerophosphate synthase